MNKENKWYNSGHTITSLMIATILIIIVCSQSFAVGGNSSLELFSSIINHNSIYLLVLVYFILLKFSFGKKYFNYLNVFLVFLYFIVTVTSFLTVIQLFSLVTVLGFTMNFVLLIYLSHTLFRDTRIWKEFKLNNSPFNELTNEWLFNAVLIVSIFLLAVNLISTVVFSGVIISILDAIYYVLLGRYVYLYRKYLDEKKINANNGGNFDAIKEDIKEQIDSVLDKTEIDEKMIEIKDNVVNTTKEFKENVEDFIKEKNSTKKEEIKEKPISITESDSELKVLEKKNENKQKTDSKGEARKKASSRVSSTRKKKVEEKKGE